MRALLTVARRAPDAWDAVKFAEAEDVAAALETSPEITQQFDEYGYTLLHYAVRRPRLDIAKVLVANGASLEDVSRNDVGENMLSLALAGGVSGAIAGVCYILLRA